jgi:6-phosphogluconolactonase
VNHDPGELRIYDTPDALAHALADLFIAHAREALAARGRFAVSLAGGTTPKSTYTLLAYEPYATALPWDNVEIFFGDERCVPPDHEQSNYRMANEAFIRPLKIPATNVHRIHGEEDPALAARAYREVLIETLGAQPRFDLVMLGMGPDGHTASLFPGSDPLTDDGQLVRAVYSQTQTQWRITLTPRALNASRAIVFAAEGAAKAKTLAAVREGPYDPIELPAQIVTPVDGVLIWLADRAAAG